MGDTQSRKESFEAFETLCWRRTLKIPCTEKLKKNEGIYLRINKRKHSGKHSEKGEKCIGYIMSRG